MLLYKNNRFHIGGVSFIIPDGFYVRTDPPVEYENGFYLVAPDSSYQLSVNACNTPSPALKELRSFFREKEISPFQWNNLTGYVGKTRYKTEEFAETQFDLASNPDGCTRFKIEIVTSTRVGLKRVMASESCRTFMQNLRAGE